MLTLLADYSAAFNPLNVFRYITFRTGGATATALLFVFWFGPAIISALRLKQGKGQPIREDGPQSHQGFSGRSRLALEAVIAVTACVMIASIAAPGLSNKLAMPFVKELMFDLGWFYVIFGALVIVGSGNAVNITDGLDGLAIVPVMIAAGTICFIAYLARNAIFANYLQIHFVPGTGELAVVCGALMGAGLGFLWFNAPPAQIFMGDTGSLALGGLLGTIAVATKHEIV